jgi:hypothetical protein
MTTITTRNGKGSPLTSTELDANFTNLNTDKADKSQVLTDVPAGAVFTDTETTTSISHNGSTKTLSFVDEVGATTNIDLTQYIDDTNLAMLVSGSLDGPSGIATFTRDDSSTFTIDFSELLDTDTNTWRSISNSVTSTSASVSASSAAVKAAYDRSWPNTTYSVGDGGLSQINFTSADHSKLNGIETGATADQSVFIEDKGSYTSDLNSLTASSDEGYYSWSSTQPTNSPGWTYGGLFVLKDDNQNLQLAIGGSGNGNQRLALRRADSGSYGDWTEFHSTADFSLTDASNWNTAYGWGNHASGGYAPIASPSFTGNLSVTGTTTSDKLLITSNSVGTESDIALTANVAINAENSLSFGMTNSSSSYYRWMFGNTSNTGGTAGGVEKMKLDPSGNLTLSGTVDGRNVAADGTKLNTIETGATADQTATQLLTAVKTVDGSGSGLDADTVDGKQAAQFFTSPTATASAWEQSNRNFSVRTGGTAAGLYMEESDGTFAFQLYGDSGNYGFLDAEWGAWDIQKVRNGTFKVDEGSGLQRVWNAGNDGSGSGLDADLLDGQQGSYYAPIASPTFGSSITTPVITMTGDQDRTKLRVWSSSSYGIGMEDNYTFGGLSDYAMTFQMNDSSTRGFWWGDAGHTNAQGAMSLTTNGKLAVADAIRVGYGQSDTTTPASGLAVSGNISVTGTVDGRNVAADGATADAAMPKAGGTHTGSFIGTNSTRNQGMIGSYTSSKTDQIWSMGSAYRNSAAGTNFGNLYGLAYKHTNNSTGGTMAAGHQMVWCQNGSPKSAMGTNIWTSGNVTAYSDARVKENLELIPNAIDKVKQLNGYTYDRTDQEPATPEEEGVTYDHNPTNRHVGVIAQEVLKVLPEAVTGGPNSNAGSEDDHYSVAYGNMVALLIEAIKEQQVQIDELKAQVKG